MKKSLIILIAVIAIIAVGAASTIAWITSTTGTLTNEFTVGDVDITLTEPNWVDDSLIVPGAAITKDPKVTVLANSEKCYVFVKIEIAADLEAVIDWAPAAGWTVLPGYTGSGVVYYRTAEKSASPQEFPVLLNNQVTVPTTVVKAQLDLVSNADDTLKITAYAIQYDYITPATAEGAWAALNP